MLIIMIAINIIGDFRKAYKSILSNLYEIKCHMNESTARPKQAGEIPKQTKFSA